MTREGPARFSIVRERRWPKGPLVFESVDFDTEVEEAARRALEDQSSLKDERGIPATGGLRLCDCKRNCAANRRAGLSSGDRAPHRRDRRSRRWVVSSTLARVVQDFAKDGTRRDAMIALASVTPTI